MKERIDTLTSLRFFAAALIVVGHGGNLPGFEQFRFTAFNLNNAVSFFFVLSGFIMSLSYYNMDLRKDFKRFISSRFARVYPVHIFLFFVYFFIFGPNIFIDGAHQYTPVAITNLTLLQSWVPLSKYYFSYNAVSWSISTEFAFYFAFPFLLLAARKYGRAALLAPIAITALLLIASVSMGLPDFSLDGGITSTGLLYINPLSRLIEFSFGMFMYEVYLSTKSKKISSGAASALEVSAIAIVVSSFYWLSGIGSKLNGETYESVGYWLSFAGSFLIVGLLILVFARQQGLLSCLLKNPIMIYLGEISFSLYMCHRLILALANNYALNFIDENPFLYYLLYWGLSLVLSATLYRFIETPSRYQLRKAFAN